MKLRLLENLHIPLWLIKDTCWAMSWRSLGMVMIVPTFSLALYLSWRSRKSPVEFWPNASVSCWITANSIWMIDEFYALNVRYASLFFFGLGGLMIIYWLWRYFLPLWKTLQKSPKA